MNKDAERETKLRKHPYAVAGLVMGALSFIQLLGLEKAIAAVVFGLIALRKIEEDKGVKGKGLAYGGIVLGAVYVLFLLYFLLVQAPQIIPG